MTDKDKRLLEKEIKEAILSERKLFLGDYPGEAKVMFEKQIVYSNIADAIILTDSEGMVGIEIKTEYDNLTRLVKQLTTYSKACSRVFAIVHDKHIEKVDKLLQGELKHVGIVAYSDYKGRPVFGRYKDAKVSPLFNTRLNLHLLWKQELLTVFLEAPRIVEEINKVANLKLVTKPHRTVLEKSIWKQPKYVINRRKKGKMVYEISLAYTVETTKRLVSYMYLHSNVWLHEDRSLTIRDFKEEEPYE